MEEGGGRVREERVRVEGGGRVREEGGLGRRVEGGGTKKKMTKFE